MVTNTPPVKGFQPPAVEELSVPPRLLLGPGPSMVDPRVLKAMATPLVGHLDPSFLRLMDKTQEFRAAA